MAEDLQMLLKTRDSDKYTVMAGNSKFKLDISNFGTKLGTLGRDLALQLDAWHFVRKLGMSTRENSERKTGDSRFQ